MRPEELPLETKLIQLAEEAAELSQASCKLLRAIKGQTPVTEAEACAHLLEEMADVYVTALALNPDRMTVEAIAWQKSRRWEERLNEPQTETS